MDVSNGDIHFSHSLSCKNTFFACLCDEHL